MFRSECSSSHRRVGPVASGADEEEGRAGRRAGNQASSEYCHHHSWLEAELPWLCPAVWGLFLVVACRCAGLDRSNLVGCAHASTQSHSSARIWQTGALRVTDVLLAIWPVSGNGSAGQENDPRTLSLVAAPALWAPALRRGATPGAQAPKGGQPIFANLHARLRKCMWWGTRKAKSGVDMFCVRIHLCLISDLVRLLEGESRPLPTCVWEISYQPM